ncbi:MAG TPA: alpha-E domain-containing protein, partial [Verrucomicrobiae bacterium]|nr:alpha-E domain-containing protein [Verrucomicrobiae bacterium]
NPRSLAFQLKTLREHAAHLPREVNMLIESPEQKRIVTLSAQLRNADLSKLTRLSATGIPEHLDSLLSDFQVELGMISNQLTHHYFSHTIASVS